MVHRGIQNSMVICYGILAYKCVVRAVSQSPLIASQFRLAQTVGLERNDYNIDYLTSMSSRLNIFAWGLGFYFWITGFRSEGNVIILSV